MKPLKSTVVLVLILSIPLQTGCRLKSERSAEFSALTAPVVYQPRKEKVASAQTGFASNAKTAVKKTAVFVGTGLLLAVGLVAWMWLDSDDETIFEEDERKRRERRWKYAWQDDPTANPAMTAAFQGDH